MASENGRIARLSQQRMEKQGSLDQGTAWDRGDSENLNIAAKAGIQLLTQIVAEQVGSFGIQVNCFAPETILTERNVQQIPDATKQELVGTHPIKRLGTTEDVAEAALFLASDQAGWITGVILDIAGGVVLR